MLPKSYIKYVPKAQTWKIIFTVLGIALVLAFVYNRGRKKGGKILDLDDRDLDNNFDYDGFVDALNSKIAGYSVFSDFGHYGLAELLQQMLDTMNVAEWRNVYNKYNQKYGSYASYPPKTLVSDIKGEWFSGPVKSKWIQRADAWLEPTV